MTCNYIEYQRMTNSLFFGVALTEDHLNSAVNRIQSYLMDGGAIDTVNYLGIGVQTISKPKAPRVYTVVRRRFVYIGGENAGRELTVNEICAIGMFLRGGPYYGKIGK